MARSIDPEGNERHLDNNFTASNVKAVRPLEISALDLMMLCLEENERRFEGYDPRLVRPTTIPGSLDARFA